MLRLPWGSRLGMGILGLFLMPALAVVLSSQTLLIQIGDGDMDTFEEDGLYALTFSQVKALLPQAAGIPWRQIRLYTGPADTLDQSPPKKDPVAHRLREVPLWVRDDGDSVFDESDSLVFWGQGTSRWQGQAQGLGPEAYRFVSNPLSHSRGYVLDLEARGDTPPFRLAVEEGPKALPESAPNPFSGGPNYLRAQRDMGTSFCDPSEALDDKAGLLWHWFWRGDCKASLEERRLGPEELQRPHLKSLPAMEPDSLWLGFDLPGLEYYPSPDNIQPALNGQAMGFVAQAHGGLMHRLWYGHRHEGGSALGDLSVLWKGSANRFGGYTLIYTRTYRWENRLLTLFPHASASNRGPGSQAGLTQAWRIQGAAGKLAIRIEEGLGSGLIRLQGSETASPGNAISEEALLMEGPASEADRLFAVVRAPRPLATTQIAARGKPPEGVLDDLLQGLAENPDYLILTPQALAASALALAQYRRSRDGGGHSVGVVRLEDIFDRYSPGRREPAAIRDFLHWAAYRWGPGGQRGKLTSVLLYGDGHYDVRGQAHKAAIDGSNPMPPFIFFTGSHTHPNISSDDMYGRFDDTLDLAIGRLPLQSIVEGMAYLNKAKSYDNPALGGAWRSRLLWAADDQIQRGRPGGDVELGLKHTHDLEAVYRSVKAGESGWDHAKILMLDYAMNPAYRKPEAAQDLVDRINQGSLLVTYFGHGAFNQWADEGLAYTQETLPRLRNAGRLAMINSFSCTVGRFENGQQDVWTERLVRQAEAGAIAGLSATRETYPTDNVPLASGFYALLLRHDSLGGPLSVGQSMLRAKNSPANGGRYNSWAYVLLGEPVLQVSWSGLAPKVAGVNDTLRALQCGSWRGQVAGGSGEGHVQVTVSSGLLPKTWKIPYPVSSEIPPRMDTLPLYAELPGKVLFTGGAPYKNGEFRIDYVLPLRLPYGDSAATLTVNAADSRFPLTGRVWRGSLKLQGVSKTANCPVENDGRGPRIAIGGCEDKETGSVDFADGVSLTLPFCLRLRVTDSVGGVQSSDGPDEGTVVSIPGTLDPFHPLPGLDDPFHKEFRLPLRLGGMKPGWHTLQVSAVDAYENRSVRHWNFRVVEDTALQVLTAFNIPNPVKRKGTVFHFASVLPSDDGEFLPVEGAVRMRYALSLFNQTGRLVARYGDIRQAQFAWDGRDAWGRALANGVYYYTASGEYNPGDGGGERRLQSRRNVLVLSR